MNGRVIVIKPQDLATKQGRKISWKRNEMFSKGLKFHFARGLLRSFKEKKTHNVDDSLLALFESSGKTATARQNKVTIIDT